MSNTQTASRATSLLTRMAAAYGVEAKKLYESLSKVAFAQKEDGNVVAPTMEEMLSLLVVCDQYKLNPFIRQIYAFKSKAGVIVPVVGIDGWLSIINRQPDYDGMDIRFSDKMVNLGGVEMPEYCECSIRRKGISTPITIPEYAQECFIKTSYVWCKYPRRMLRHKAVIQAARVAFGIGGIYDEDEASNFDGDFSVKNVAVMPQAIPTPAIPERSDEQTQKILTDLCTMAQERNNWAAVPLWIEQNIVQNKQPAALAFCEKKKAELNQSASLGDQFSSIDDAIEPLPEKVEDPMDSVMPEVLSPSADSNELEANFFE